MRLKYYLSCILLLLVFAGVNAQEKKEELKAGDQSPVFKYVDINGKEVSLSDLKGKYVYIDVWATWCPPCRGELPHLKELEKKMHGKNIVFVSISCDKDKAAWEKMVKEQGLGGIQLHNGGDREFMKAYNITGIPRFILLDKEGKIVNPKMTRPSNPETEKTLNALKGI
ncbi:MULTISPECIES: TlpA family protein disulfide reductase [Butyricimonas]|uniref:TlpA family protein disulfide reductase n=1 Tax=Butyricimonas TaxID=574697 RepID=UPI00037D32F8